MAGEKDGQMEGRGYVAERRGYGHYGCLPSDHMITEVMTASPLRVLRKSSVSLFASRAALGGRSARRPDGEQGLVEEKRLSEH